MSEEQQRVLICGLLMSMIFLASAPACVAESMAVPPEAIDEQKIFWGTASKFEKPGSVDYFALVSATDDYKTAQKAEKIY